MTDKHQCDRCDCEVDASDKLSDGSYRCDECFTFFAEINWYDPDNREERIEDYLKMKREEHEKRHKAAHQPEGGDV